MIKNGWKIKYMQSQQSQDTLFVQISPVAVAVPDLPQALALTPTGTCDLYLKVMLCRRAGHGLALDPNWVFVRAPAGSGAVFMLRDVQPPFPCAGSALSKPQSTMEPFCSKREQEGGRIRKYFILGVSFH